MKYELSLLEYAGETASNIALINLMHSMPLEEVRRLYGLSMVCMALANNGLLHREARESYLRKFW